MTSLTYCEAGVDIDLERTAIEALIHQLSFRRKGAYGMIGEIGHFSGLIEFGTQVLALTTDGVGTKMLVAERLKNWTTIGIDCIAMNVNDLYVMNIEPIAFVDYIATDHVSEMVMSQIGVGLNEGARQANLNIVGGETATLKGLVNGLDLAGTCLGVQARDRVVTGNRIRPGDVVVGIPSNGIHSNGLTLARRIVETYSDYDERLHNGRKLGEELLNPTRIYHQALAVCAACTVHGMCHITGGGLLNFLRLTRYGFDIDFPLPPQELFSWLKENGEISTEEMYRTFNMGMGFAFILPQAGVENVKQYFPDSQVVGTCVEKSGIRVEGHPVEYR